VIHPSSGIPDFSPFPLTRIGLRAASGAGRARPQRHRSLRRPTGSPTDGLRVKGQHLSFTDGENTADSTLTRDGKTCDRMSQSGRTTGRLPPPFSSSFPPPVSQLRRWIVSWCIRWGYTPLALRRYPSYPIDGEGGAPLLPPEYDHQPDAATKGTQERLPPQFSSGTLFPHQKTRLRRYSSCLRQSVLNSSTARLPGRPPA
jgi:hypothetical protein